MALSLFTACRYGRPNDFLILINDFLILINDFLILMNGMIY